MNSNDTSSDRVARTQTKGFYRQKRYPSANGNKNVQQEQANIKFNIKPRGKSESRLRFKSNQSNIDENNPFDKIFHLINNNKKREFLELFVTIMPFINDNKEISTIYLNSLVKKVHCLNMNEDDYKIFSTNLYKMRKNINTKDLSTMDNQEYEIFPNFEDVPKICNETNYNSHSFDNFTNKTEYYKRLFDIKLQKMLAKFSPYLNIFNNNNDNISENELKIKELTIFMNQLAIVFDCQQQLKVLNNSLILMKQKKSDIFFYGIVLNSENKQLTIEICSNQSYKISSKLFSSSEYLFIKTNINLHYHLKTMLFLSQHSSSSPTSNQLDNMEKMILKKNIPQLDLENTDKLLKNSTNESLFVISGQHGCGKTTLAQQLVTAIFEKQQKNKNISKTKEQYPILVLCHSIKSLLLFFMKFQNKNFKLFDSYHYFDEPSNMTQYYNELKTTINYLNILEKQDYVLSLTTLKNFNVVDEKILKFFNEEEDRNQDSNFYDWLLCNWDKTKWKCQYQHKSYKFSNDCKFRYVESRNHLLKEKMKYLNKTDVKSLNAYGRIQNKLDILSWSLKPTTLNDVHPLMQKNLWSLNPFEKWQLYNYWIENLKILIWTRLTRTLKNIQIKLNEHHQNQIQLIIDEMKNQKIIGLTFSSAIHLQNALRAIEFSSVFIDDADLLEESDMISFKGIWNKLYLFGTESLFKNFSLFSRLALDNRVPSLKYQRRMRPKFTDLLKELFVSPMKSIQTLNQLSMIFGMNESIAFYQYNNLQNLKYTSIEFESVYLINFALYLLRQGHYPKDITILSINPNDVKQLRQVADEHNLHLDITIDSIYDYHGLENDIILIALGTLSEYNEQFILSSLTRARNGLYIIGECKILLSNIIFHYFDPLISNAYYSNGFPLKCRLHRTKWYAKGPKDFNRKLEDGGHGKCIM